eukprot:CFRG6150T1
MLAHFLLRANSALVVSAECSAPFSILRVLCNVREYSTKREDIPNAEDAVVRESRGKTIENESTFVLQDPRDGRRRVTRLGLLAWDAKEELAQLDGMSIYEQTESAMERIANAKIRRAIEQGELDNLPGAGKPIARTQADIHNLSPNDQTYLGNKVLKNAGFVPKWVELTKAIDEKREILRNILSTLAPHQQPTDLSQDLLRKINDDIVQYNHCYEQRWEEKDLNEIEFCSLFC